MSEKSLYSIKNKKERLNKKWASEGPKWK